MSQRNSQCSVDGCGAQLRAKGLCLRHYERMRRYGTTSDGKYAQLPFEQRLWRHIERRGPDECWPWTGSTKIGGYGTLSRGGAAGKFVRAHRAVWEQFNGPIPQSRDYHGAVVMHRCDNRACCNPTHLVLGTQAQNVRDMVAKGRNYVIRLRGESNPRARLTDVLVRLFRTSQKSCTELAREHGCCPSTVSLIRRRKTWRHLSP